MKTVRVVAAVIKALNDNGEPIIFATHLSVSNTGISTLATPIRPNIIGKIMYSVSDITFLVTLFISSSLFCNEAKVGSNTLLMELYTFNPIVSGNMFARL